MEDNKETGKCHLNEHIFSSTNFVKCTETNRYSNEVTTACVKLINSKYESNGQKLSENKQ